MKILFIFFSGFLLVSCNFKGSQEYLAVTEEWDSLEMENTQDHPGKQLMENNCYMCHSPKATEENMIAPPMVAVKMHYLSEDTSKEDFVNGIVAFLKNPSEDISKMPGAVKKFGLMPYQFYAENTIRQIADYMYEYEIDEPTWFENHYREMHGDRSQRKGRMSQEKGRGMGRNQTDKAQQLSIEERGMQIAQATKAELGKNLMGQIQKNGVIAALDFCNIQAMPLTDSMSMVHRAHITRVSDKPRNPKNQANATELIYIQTFKNQVAAGEEPTPIVTTMGEKAAFYYPIITNSMCLKCHGTPGKELESLTLSNILKHYPKDKATEYDENEVRGIWSIEISR